MSHNPLSRLSRRLHITYGIAPLVGPVGFAGLSSINSRSEPGLPSHLFNFLNFSVVLFYIPFGYLFFLLCGVPLLKLLLGTRKVEFRYFILGGALSGSLIALGFISLEHHPVRGFQSLGTLFTILGALTGFICRLILFGVHGNPYKLRSPPDKPGSTLPRPEIS